MRIGAFSLAITLMAPAWADSIQGNPSGWFRRALELGIDSAYVVLEYSLTDSCDLGPVKIVENSHPTLFDGDAVAEITQSVIGPFDSPNHEILEIDTMVDSKPRMMSMTRRMFSWNTDLGHRYLLCDFYADGTFAMARYVDGNRRPAKNVEDRPVARRLSELGTQRQKIVFRIEE